MILHEKGSVGGAYKDKARKVRTGAVARARMGARRDATKSGYSPFNRRNWRQEKGNGERAQGEAREGMAEGEAQFRTEACRSDFFSANFRSNFPVCLASSFGELYRGSKRHRNYFFSLDN